MIAPTRLGLGIVALALITGALGDALLRSQAGLNVVLWIGSILLAAGWLAQKSGIALAGEGRWLALPVLFLAAAVAWRDSPTLRALDCLTVALALSLAVLYSRSGQLRQAGVTDYALAMAAGAAHILFSPFLLLFKDITLQGAPRARWTGPAAALLRGLLIAIPLLLLFGLLFAAADAAFARLLSGLFSVDLSRLIGHTALTLFLAWLAAGLLRSLLWAEPPRLPAVLPPRAFSLGAIEVGTVLGAMNALFLVFVAVQFRYFFGGIALVEAAAELTYALYARRGFFELVAVAALVLPVLLAALWLARTADPRHRQILRRLAGALVGSLFLIMGSALHRMWLYQAAYGLTELRLYATSFMIGLAVVFVWFCATVLRERRDRFAFGVLVSGLTLLALLHALNPDAVIARQNLGRLHTTGRFDAAYVVGLSADAVPALLAALPSLPSEQRQMVAAQLLHRWGEPARTDWRAWNWGRARARAAVRAERAALEAAARFGGLQEEDNRRALSATDSAALHAANDLVRNRGESVNVQQASLKDGLAATRR